MPSIFRTIYDWQIDSTAKALDDLYHWDPADAAMLVRMCVRLERQASPILGWCWTIWLWVAVALLTTRAAITLVAPTSWIHTFWHDWGIISYLYTFVVLLCAQLIFRRRLIRRIKAEAKSTTSSPSKRLRACPACGYDLHASPQPTCPECGQNSRLSITQDQSSSPPPQSPG